MIETPTWMALFNDLEGNELQLTEKIR